MKSRACRMADASESALSLTAPRKAQFRQYGPMIGCSDSFIEDRVTPRAQSAIHKDVVDTDEAKQSE